MKSNEILENFLENESEYSSGFTGDKKTQQLASDIFSSSSQNDGSHLVT